MHKSTLDIENDRWQEYIRRGNTEFSLKYFGNAILMYHQALDDARFTYASTAQQSHDNAISRIVICYFNLANCYIKLDQIVRASDFYAEAQDFLVRVNETSATDCQDLQNAILHAGSHIDTVWLDFLREHRDEVSQDRIMEYYQASLALKNKPLSVIYH